MQTFVQKIAQLKRKEQQKNCDLLLNHFERVYKAICDGDYDEQIVQHIEKSGVKNRFFIKVDIESGASIPRDLHEMKRIQSRKTVADEYLVEMWVDHHGSPWISIDLDSDSFKNGDYFFCRKFLFYITCNFCLSNFIKRIFCKQKTYN